ncbi:MAG: hypothetical protein HY855_10815 [Burkholderiales bacterium]|nr:hypothetical protein [Burkholderiales bacterium]
MATTARTRRKTPEAAAASADQAPAPAAKRSTTRKSAQAPAAKPEPAAAPERKAAPGPAKARRATKPPATSPAPAPAGAATAKKAAATKKAAPVKKTAPRKKTTLVEAPAAPAAPEKQAAPARKTAPAKEAAPAKKAAPARKAATKKAAAPRKTAAVPAAAGLEPAMPVEAEAPAAAMAKAPAGRKPAAPAPAPAPAPGPAPGSRRRTRGAATVPADSAPVIEPAHHAAVPAPAATPAAPAPTGPAHSAVRLFERDAQRHLSWQPGHACPSVLAQAAQARLDAQGHLRPDDDDALPTLLRLAAQTGHPLAVDEAVWLQLAADRDARHRLQALEAAHPAGPGSPALQTLLHATALPPYQAEGALFAVVAGRALIADERGLGKSVQAVAAAALWRRHFGVRRVLVLATAAQGAQWLHAWVRLLGDALAPPPQLVQGPLHQRQALWSAAAEVRILSPDTLAQDEAHWRRWQPELVIVDEPQQLPGWTRLQAPHALVLCGAPLAGDSALLVNIIDWLDQHRQGALHALHRMQAARDRDESPSEELLQQLDRQLSRQMLQRLRDEVQDQLPPLVHSARWVTPAPAQREAQAVLHQQARALLLGWQDSGYLSDTDQRLLLRLQHRLLAACHREVADDDTSPLAEATLATLQAQLDDWASRGGVRIALRCPQPADRAQMERRLVLPAGLHWLHGDEDPPAEADVVLGVGLPALTPPQADGPGTAPARPAPTGRQWVHVLAGHGLEQGLFDTLATRQALRAWPPAQGFLHGRALVAWLQGWQLALQAVLPG